MIVGIGIDLGCMIYVRRLTQSSNSFIRNKGDVSGNEVDTSFSTCLIYGKIQYKN